MTPHYKADLWRTIYQDMIKSRHNANDQLSSPSTQTHNTTTSTQWLRKYSNTAIAAAAELTLGQPLDRLKVHYQTPAWSRVGALPPFTPNNWYYWYAGNYPAMLQRCGIYFPAITASAGLADTLLTDQEATTTRIMKPLIVSCMVTPYVTLFEAIKSQQQLGGQQKTITPGYHLSIRDIIKNKKSGGHWLLAAWLPTLCREYFFVGGMLILQPLIAEHIHNYLDNRYSHQDLKTTSDAQTRISLPHIALLSKLPSDARPPNPYTVTAPDTIKQTSNNTINMESVGIWAISSLIASAISQAISQPLDTWKTRIEIQPTTSIWTTASSIPLRMWWSGLAPRIIRGAWTFACINAILRMLE